MTKAHEEIINFIAGGTTSRSVSAFTASPKVKARVEGLVRKRKTGSLLPAEEQELTDYLQLEHLMRLAGAKSGPRDLSRRKGYSRRATTRGCK